MNTTRHSTKCGHQLVALIVFVALLGIQTSAGAATAASDVTNRVDYAIIVTGGELLDGAFPDGHTSFLTRTLHPLGLHCVGSMIVDDRADDIKEALHYATNQARLVIVTGGLGPTDNDVTRPSLSEFTGIAIREQPEVLAELARRFNTPADKLRENLRRQTRAPIQGTYLKNRNGTAVGLVFDPGHFVVVALPGPPRELQPMVRDELVPYLTRRFGTRSPGCALTLRFVGVGQSQIDQALKEHVPLDRDIILNSAFEASRVDFTFSLPIDSAEDRVRLRQLEEKILRHLGEFIYADDGSTLEDVVVAVLRARGATLALVEVGSGGTLAASLNLARNAPEVLKAAIVAASDDQAMRVVRAEVAASDDKPSEAATLKSLARAAQALAGANGAVVVGEVKPGSSGAGSVEVFSQLNGLPGESKRFSVRGSDSLSRSALVTQILDHLRRRLEIKVVPRVTP